MKKVLALLTLLLFKPASPFFWGNNNANSIPINDMYDDYGAIPQETKSWMENPKVFLLIGLGVAGGFVIWKILATIDTIKQKKQEQAPGQQELMFLSNEMQQQSRQYEQQSNANMNMQLMSNIGQTGMALSQQLGNHVDRLGNQVQKDMKQMLRHSSASIEQQFNNVNAKLEEIDKRLAIVENKVGEIQQKIQQ